jgi:hypothetical protein
VDNRLDQFFTARETFDPAHPSALAVYCSDGRFTNAVEELLHHRGHSRLDTLTIPGGPGLLNLWSAQFSDMDAVSRAASFLISGHALTHVVLLAHQGCGYYRARYAARSPKQIMEQQLGDLRTAGRLLRTSHSNLSIELYYAVVRDGRVVFEVVPAEP